MANYLEALGHNVSGQEEGAGGADDTHEGTTLRRIHQGFNRTEDLIMLMSTLAMEPCTPVNGFRYTFSPWNIRQRPKILDMLMRTDNRERVFTTRVETDMNAALATGHVPLRCELTCDDNLEMLQVLLTTKASPEICTGIRNRRAVEPLAGGGRIGEN